MKSPSISKGIWIEWREPETKRERNVFGQTRFTNCHTARIFINNQKTMPQQIRTFWHEMVHVFLTFHEKGKKRINLGREEDLCYRLEGIIWEVLR